MKDELVCGPHAVLAALKAHADEIDGVWVSTERQDRRVAAVLVAARTARIKVHRAPRAALDRMSEGVSHQGVIARRMAAPRPTREDPGEFVAGLSGKPLILVLDGVQDPHNLGACLRVADAAGAQAVVVPRDRAAALSAVARRAAAGAAETMPLLQVTNLARALDELKQAGLWIIGTAAEAEQDVFQADLRQPVALVLGGEGKGLRRLTQERCDLLVRIPMAGTVESLNVSVAAGICLFEVLRQRSMIGKL
jgi:23S rRNA (guanosine2251-2'-O)-methyltransferase